ncbi:hypothetical protein M4578_25380 [Salipiger sp. P9]|nr:hypothetical protein [Salipiger pentaromativorans]
MCTKINTGLRLAIVGLMAMSLSGCLAAAVAVPLATTAGMTAATSTASDRLTSYVARVHRMNCSQLRQEYARLQKDGVARVNPLSNWTGRRAAVVSTASNKGCRLG